MHAQAINLCEIAFLTFNYPNPVPANQPVTVTTTVTLYSCPVGPLRARIDLFDSHQNLISTSSNNVNSARVDVTNTFTAPQTSGQYPVYATAYMILFGSVVGSYRSSFLLSVVPPNEMTISTTAVQSSSQATTSLSIMTSTSNLASTESTSTTFAPTISNQNVSAFNVSSDMLYESVIFLAVLFIVALVVLSIRRRKKD